MNPERRRQLRSARSLRCTNQQDDGGASNDLPAPGTQRRSGEDRAAPPGAAAPSGGARRSSIMVRDEAQRLSQRMQQQRQDKTKADRLLSEREALIQERYAPGTTAPPLSRGPTTQQQQQAAAAAMAAASTFDKDELLANLIGDNKANFLKLDHDLREDHTISTRRLHNSVFAHANSFLLLFRDVDRASDLVEALKANVQGTKAAISSISKYSSANIVADSAVSGRGGGGTKAPNAAAMNGASSNGFSSALSSTAGESDPRRLARPSLITRRITNRYNSRGSSELTGGDVWLNSSSDIGSESTTRKATRATTWASTVQRSGAGDVAPSPAVVPTTARNSSSGNGAGGDGGAADAPMNTGATRPTTRGLNVSSVRQWRYTIGLAGTSPTAAAMASAGSADQAGDGSGHGRRFRVDTAGGKTGVYDDITTAAAKAEKEATETMSFVNIVREEVSQMLTERRHVDAAELLYRLADEATAKGCLPFLLDLEAALVSSVITNVVMIPVTPMYVESLHIPLVQLLLRFGRSRSAAAVYLSMQTPWLHSTVQKLQARVNPQYASLIAVDYLVRVTRATVRRQHTLGLGLDAAQPFMADAAVAGISAAATSSTSKAEIKRKLGAAATVAGRDGVSTNGKTPAAAAAAAGKLIPPNSAALLWVRRNVERFACDVLATHLLSFGTGTDDGDPTRIRQAAQMISQTSRVMQVLSADGFAGCDTLILRQLTPSLVILEDDFTRLIGEKIDHSGRAMMEQLIMGSLIFYELNEANAAAIAATAEATAAYAATVAKLSTSPTTTATTAGGDAKKSTKSAAAAADTSGPKMPPRPPPLRMTPPYVPSKSDDVARKVRARCQEMVQVIRTLPLSGHSLLVQLLLAPASSSLFNAATTSMAGGASSPCNAASSTAKPSTTTTGGSRAGADRSGGALPVGKTPAALSPLTRILNCFPPLPPPPLSAELFRFLRYANGCSTTQVFLLQSLCGYIAALTGTSHLPAEVMASAAAQEREGANAAAATAMREQQMECVAYLLTSAMVTESIDVVLCNLFTTMLLGLLRQRRALVRFLSSDAFLTRHRRVLPLPTGDKADAISDRPFFSDPANAPGWVLDGTLSLLSDVLGIGVWISYFTRGGAMAHMLADAEFGFRTQHLERVQREVPRLVQGWMCASLLLSGDVTRASTTLAPARKTVSSSATLCAPLASSPLLTPQQSVLFCARAPERGGGTANSANTFSPTASSPNRVISNMSFSAAAAAAQSTMSATRKDTREGVDTASVLLSIPVTSGTGMPTKDNDVKDAVATTVPFFADATVREERLLKFVMTLLDRKYRTPADFTVHNFVVDSATAVDSATGAPCGVWAVRRRLGSYPEFPVGNMWAHRTDEVFLFHWCVQVSLHLLTFFQERLVTPSATVNQRAAEAQGNPATFLANGLPFPIQGCIMPQEDTVLAGWCAGGGNYVTAIALLQFLVMRLLRDGLCRVETWSAVYDCPVAQWRADESVLRQQLFFFALFLHLWAPLFTGGRASRPRTGGAASAPRTAAAAVGATGNTDDSAVSSYLVDGLPPIAILEWMTCGGILSPAAAPNFVDTAMASAAPDTIPLSLTAIDVLFATEGTIHVAGVNKKAGVTSTSHSSTDAGSAAAWKAKAGGSSAIPSAAATENVTPFAAVGTSTNAMLAKRDLFGVGASSIPDGPLRVVRRFFEEQLVESRAIPAITSDVMRNRVEKAMADINLTAFMHTTFDADDDSDSGDASVTSSASTSGTRGGRQASPQKTTLQNLRDLIATYVRPVS